ncbi:MAG: 4'-phosphopantetheinyl transferase superfamily protein [Clostridia bacterium]|nr:4'-phosphopantetheinyl transferase superfamily protein [Clostridia bacterium]
MEKIYYADKSAYPTSEVALLAILKKDFALDNEKIFRGDNGKPYHINTPLFFSVSHTQDKLFIAFSDENVGIDAENADRKTEYRSIIKRFTDTERKKIFSNEDFLKAWTAKESAVKWLGGTLAHDLFKLEFLGDKMKYGEIELPAKFTLFQIDGCWVTVCSERDFSQAEIIRITV